MLLHEAKNPWIGLPFRCSRLIAADVHIRVGEECDHLREEAFEKHVGLFSSWVHRIGRDAEGATDCGRSWPAGELRVSKQPGRAVAGHLKLRHHTDTAVCGIGHDLAYLVLRIKQTVGADLCQLRKDLALQPAPHIHLPAPAGRCRHLSDRQELPDERGDD